MILLSLLYITLKLYNFRNTLCLIGIACALSGCGIEKWFGFEEEDQQASAKKIYDTAKSSLLTQKYSSALEKYQELEQKYPFSQYARSALIESAYANYKSTELEKSIAYTQRFIKNYPDDSKLDYAYYLQGLCYFAMGKTLVHYILPRDPTTKSPQSLIKSFDVFSELYNRFPNSIYRPDVKYRLAVLRNMLAIHEIRVASFYIKRESYIATVNRIKYMLERYEGAQHTPDGLYLMAVAYRRLGHEDLALDTLRVLRENYPQRIDANLELTAEAFARTEKSIMDHLRNLGNVFLEKVSIKPRY